MRRSLAHLLLILVACAPLAAASLWQAETLADGTLYSDQVARRSGDLITILVKETTSVTDQQKTETSRKNTLSAKVTQLPGTTRLPAALGASAAGALPALGADSNKDFEGEGKYQATGEVKAVITGRVIDVLDNGNLVVEGRRTVKVNGDSKEILITGIVRGADVRSDNTVASEKLHNFQVAIVGEGPLSRAQQEGWLSQIADILWPF